MQLPIRKLVSLVPYVVFTEAYFITDGLLLFVGFDHLIRELLFMRRILNHYIVFIGSLL
jgi:hypothetical protein